MEKVVWLKATFNDCRWRNPISVWMSLTLFKVNDGNPREVLIYFFLTEKSESVERKNHQLSLSLCVYICIELCVSFSSVTYQLNLNTQSHLWYIHVITKSVYYYSDWVPNSFSYILRCCEHTVCRRIVFHPTSIFIDGWDVFQTKRSGN